MARRYPKYAWFVLIFNVLVILWGAVVRATGSGAGCGDHWPLCNGQVVPLAAQTATAIEFFHRLTSGAALLLVLALLIGALRLYPRRHPARTGAVLSAVFILTESLVGAFIVLQQLTAKDSSAARAVVISLHQANTLLLLGALTLTAWWAGAGPADAETRRPHLRGRGPAGVAVLVGIAGMFLLGATGAITALGDTLFPATSLAEGFRADFEADAHFLVQLRVIHPVVAVLMGAYVAGVGWLVHRRVPDERTRTAASALTLVFLTQFAIGVLNLTLLAPVAMQIVHLLMADVVWIVFVLLAARVFSQPRPLRAAVAPADVQPSVQ